MSVLSKKDLMERLKTIIGDSTDDEALSFVEDVSDTYDGIAKSDQEDWKAKYEENDRQWREKYRDRFFNGGNTDNDTIEDSPIDETDDPEKPMIFDNLFKED